MKKVLVTGATGFIGNYVIQALLTNNCEVVATSSNEKKAAEFSWFKSVTYHELDFNALDTSLNYYELFHRPDAMIHLAWEGLPNYESLHHFEKNLPRHYAFIKNLVVHGLADISVAGTCFEYGLQQGCLSEDMCTMPSNSYAIAKDTLRKFLQQLQKENAFTLKWIRLFYLYGKGQNSKSLFSQLDLALENKEPIFNMSGGEQLRDYLSVEEVAANIVRIASQKKVEGVINCCSGKPIAIKQLVEAYLKNKQAQIKLNLGYYPYSPLEPMTFWGDTEKLALILESK